MFAGAFLVAALAIVFDLRSGIVGWLAGRRSHPRTKTRRTRDVASLT